MSLADAWAVLRGKKTAMDNSIPGLIDQVYRAAKTARHHQPEITKIMPELTSTDEAAQHNTAVTRMRVVLSVLVLRFLLALPAFFISVKEALEAARAGAPVGSAERKELERQRDEAIARGNELEALIGEGFVNVEAADAADNELLAETTPPPPVNPPLNPEGQEAAPNPPISAVTGEPTTPVGAVVGSDTPEGVITPDLVAAATDTSGPPADSTQPTPSTGAGQPASLTGDGTGTALPPIGADQVGSDPGTVPPTPSSDAPAAEGTGPAPDTHTGGADADDVATRHG